LLVTTRGAPAGGDVIVRPKPGDTPIVYLLGTPGSPDQFILRNREEAFARALSYARYHHVRAWFSSGHNDFVLLDASLVEMKRSTG
jgi:hypothetical protein